MSVFYPDNERRAGRVQQLVDSITNMQTDMEKFAQQMDEKNTQLRPAINDLLTANGLQSVDDLINKASAQLSLEERRKFEALIEKFKTTKTNLRMAETLAGLLIVAGCGFPSFVFTGRHALSIANFCWSAIRVQMIAQTCGAAARGAGTAAEVMAMFASEEEAVLLDLGDFGSAVAVGEGVVDSGAAALGETAAAGEAVLGGGVALAGEAALGGEVALAGEAAMATSGIAMASLSAVFKYFVYVGTGFAIGLSVYDAVQARNRMKDLVAVIHHLQPSRLTTALCKEQGTKVMAVFHLMPIYLKALYGPEANPTMADSLTPPQIAKAIVDIISHGQNAIDLDKLESDLEAQDRRSSLFYGDEDLSHADVVSAARRAAERERR